MEQKKRLVAILLAAAILCSNFILTRNNVNAASDIQVLLDGRTLAFEVPPQIINDRTMVPFRAIGESMGASVEWEGTTQQITMYLNNSYVILYIGNKNMTYGEFSLDDSGVVTPISSLVYALDASPVIVNSRTLVPVRAISEGLGASVDWNDITKTVIISSPIKPVPTIIPTPDPTPSPTPSPTPDPTPSPTPDTTFDNTTYFEEISGRQAQAMYDNNEKFILAFYSHLDEPSAEYLPLIKEAAHTLRYKIYGVDIDSIKFDNTGNILNFIWNYINRTSNYPAVFYVNGKLDVSVYVKPNNRSLMERQMDDFWRKTISTPTPSPGGTATPSPNIADKTRFTNRSELTTMYNRGDKFIYFYYNSAIADVKAKAEMIMQAAINTGITIYAIDTYFLTNDTPWGTQFTNGSMSNPTLFYVKGNGSSDVTIKTTFYSIAELENEFYTFKQ